MMVKAESSALKIDLLHKDTQNSMVSTMMKYLLLLFISHKSVSCPHLQLKTKWKYIKLMFLVHFKW